MPRLRKVLALSAGAIAGRQVAVPCCAERVRLQLSVATVLSIVAERVGTRGTWHACWQPHTAGTISSGCPPALSLWGCHHVHIVLSALERSVLSCMSTRARARVVPAGQGATGIVLSRSPLWCVSVFAEAVVHHATTWAGVRIDGVRVEAASPLLSVRGSHLGGEQPVGTLQVVQPSLPRFASQAQVCLAMLLFFLECARGSRVRLLDLRAAVASGLSGCPWLPRSSDRCSLRPDCLVAGLPLAACGLRLELLVLLHLDRRLLLQRHCSPKAL